MNTISIHTEPFSRFKKEDFRANIAAAYDLRSRYVHTGSSFGQWVSLRMGSTKDEVQVGKPVVEDKDLGEVIAKAPTLVGLERIIRYSLLKFAQENHVFKPE